MAEYIERQAAIDELNEQIECCDKALGSFDIALKDEYAVKVERASLIAYKERLEAIPTADVITTAPARWEPIARGERGYSAGDFICSACHLPNKCYNLTDFCPNCGARMEKHRIPNRRKEK